MLQKFIMPTYRLLSSEELMDFKEDFIKYLVVNGIDADQWEQLLSTDAEKAEKIVDLFSDVVFEKVMRGVRFLEIRSKGYVQAIQCLDDRMIMVAVSAKGLEIDFATTDLTSTDISGFDIHKGEKGYGRRRELELFELTEKGYEISSGDLFKSLILATI